ncbi:hypothetical protein H0H92_014722 [Tricholoma furcatifolium]|nr:hypothetical protein H0H92_014722 [Tricholoma furcatifolium]
MGFDSMTRDLNCTSFQATIGLSVYALGFGIVPLVSASFSEEFGRRPLYLGSTFGFLLMFMMIALYDPSILLCSKADGSTGPKIFKQFLLHVSFKELLDRLVRPCRGLPMSIFALAALGGTGIGPLIAGWIEMNPRLEWRWIQWIQMIIFGAYFITIPLVLTETRSAILLTRLAKKMRKETGNNRYRARVEDQRPSLKHLIFISCTRPVLLMLTEPIVLAFSLWIGFAWGVMFGFIESIAGDFETLHGFNIGQVGTLFVTMTIGSIIGFACNLYQEKLYKKDVEKRGPEARLHTACFAAIMLPVGMFIYAWTGYTRISWVGQAIGIIQIGPSFIVIRSLVVVLILIFVQLWSLRLVCSCRPKSRSKSHGNRVPAVLSTDVP